MKKGCLYISYILSSHWDQWSSICVVRRLFVSQTLGLSGRTEQAELELSPVPVSWETNQNKDIFACLVKYNDHSETSSCVYTAIAVV